MILVTASPKKLPPTSTPIGDFEISQEELSQMGRDTDVHALQRLGGVSILDNVLLVTIISFSLTLLTIEPFRLRVWLIN